MNKRRYFPILIALAVLGWTVAHFPPFQITWQRFLFTDRTPVAIKLAFLLKVYGLPCCLSMGAIILYQLQARLGALGASGSAIFPMALIASGCMMSAFRSMASGVGGVP